MKRPFYPLLILVVLLSVGLVVLGCGESEGSVTSAAPTETTAGEPTETTAGAKPIKILTAMGDVEGTGNAEMAQYFMDYVQEKSGGAITFEAYFGGSFCKSPEVPEFTKKGELGLSYVPCVYSMTSFPLGFSLCGYDSMQGTMDILWDLLADPEINALIQTQAEENNWHLVGYTAAGRSLLLSKTEVKSWADAAARKLTIGSPINLDIYSSLGLNTTAVEPPDMYEALSRGVCDLVAFSGTGIFTQKLTECANHIGDMRSYFAGLNIMFNLDLWNSFTDEQKALMEEAAKASSDWSVAYNADIEGQLEEEITKLGGTWNTFTDEEGKMLNQKLMAGTVAMLNHFADNIGQRDKQDQLTAAWAKALNQTF